MSRKTSPEVPTVTEAPDPHPLPPHALPSEGGCYVIEAGVLLQVDAPTAVENPNPSAPLTEA